MPGPAGPVRALHYVFKVAERTESIKYYKGLGMKVLRHEEFTEGCEAACNGPYDGKWSKTMIGYADEDTSFVLELTYNYGVASYELGNDFAGMLVRASKVYAAAKALGGTPGNNGRLHLAAPDGYMFDFEDGQPGPQGPLQEVALSVTNLEQSLAYWHGFLGFSIEQQPSSGPTPSASLSCGQGQCRLRLVQLPPGTTLDRGTAYGRIAFSCPGGQLQPLEAECKAAGRTILTPYVSLDTPGKASVQVVILADPDGHEICFVGDEGFRELSRTDEKADALLQKAMDGDASRAWHAKRAARRAAT